MRILIDTNQYRAFCQGTATAVQAVRQADLINIPFVVLGELRAGFACGSRSLQNEKNLMRFLNTPRVHMLYADEDTTHQYARLFRQLRSQGTPLPTNDLWIAALAVQHDLLLLSDDRHFDKLPQIARA